MKLGTPMSLLAHQNHNLVSNDLPSRCVNPLQGWSTPLARFERVTFAAMDLCSVEILVAEWLGLAPSETRAGARLLESTDQQPLRIYR
jgi:hypothetical protein